MLRRLKYYLYNRLLKLKGMTIFSKIIAGEIPGYKIAENDKFAAFLDAFPGRITDAHEFALQHRVLLAQTRSGIPIDAALGALPFEERSIQRATVWKWSERGAIKTCSAEDLVIHKCFAGRDRDWSDLESILTRQGGKLDLGLVRRELPPLLELKGTGPMMRKLEDLLKAIERRFDAGR